MTAAVLLLLSPRFPFSDWPHIAVVLAEISPENIARVSESHFAFAIASAIVQVAIALALAFLICHVILLRLALRSARRALGRDDARSFAGNFESISDRLEANGLIGDSWHEFRETTVPQDDVVHNTLRPQTFINASDARERLFGLKMMSSIPGFFVGLGLLLTFIGLVLALSKAVNATGASSAEGMTSALNDLLSAATFKFSTSIAGLGASLVLSLVFRSYQIWIDAGYFAFCHALERRLDFNPGQRVAMESQAILAEQRDQLKEINSDRFFSRLGDSIAPGIQSAVGSALGPVAERIDHAVGELAQSSRSGVDDMAKQFLEGLRGGAGTEIAGISRSLEATKAALEAIQANLVGSGGDFSRQMEGATERLRVAIEEAGRALGGSASAAGGMVQSTMAGVAEALQAQMTKFADALSALEATLAGQAEESTRRSLAASNAATEASNRATDASLEAARQTTEAVRDGMGEVIQALRNDLAGLSATLVSVGSALANQNEQIDSISSRSRETADAFGRIATDVRAASEPLRIQGERISSATDRMARSVGESVSALSATQEAAQALAQTLTQHFDQINLVWSQYEARFKGVDDDLGRMAERFHEEVTRHQEAMRDFVVEIDRHAEAILSKTNTASNAFGENVASLNEVLDEFLTRFARPEHAG